MVDPAPGRQSTVPPFPDDRSPSASGPLQRRLLDGIVRETSAEPETSVSEFASTSPEPPLGIQHATLGLLDGTVIARLACHESIGTVVIGRGSAAEIQVHDTFAHRIHAEINWETMSRSHVITHAGGANGTLVNLQRITSPTRLIDGARIRIGKTEIVYRRIWYPGDA